MSFYPAKRTRADHWFSFFIRFRDNFTCQTCGKYCLRRKLNNPDLPMSKIECSHVFSRRHQSVRFDERNAFTQCVTCHEKAEQNKKDYEAWAEKRLGQADWNALVIKKSVAQPHFQRIPEAVIAGYYRDEVQKIAQKHQHRRLMLVANEHRGRGVEQVERHHRSNLVVLKRVGGARASDRVEASWRREQVALLGVEQRHPTAARCADENFRRGN